MNKTFRFDDVSIETDLDLLDEISDYILSTLPGSEVILGCSPLTYGRTGQEFIDRKLLAYSDHRLFYNVKNCGIPTYIRYADKMLTIASHGLVHVDHRFLSRETQEFSIVVSCQLLNSNIFIPPFNKWNADTESVCSEHNIKLIKFEDGWKCCEYNKYDEKHDLWYLHSSNFKSGEFEKWMKS